MEGETNRLIGLRGRVLIAGLGLVGLFGGADASSVADAATWPTCPSSDPEASDPLPEPASALDPRVYPPPPGSFRPERVRYVGTRTWVVGYGDPAWTGAIDGSGMRCGAPAHGRLALATGDRVIYWDDTDPAAIPDLLVREPSGVVRTLADQAESYDLGPRFVWVGRRAGTVADPGADLGVWRVALDGSGMRRMLRAGDRGRSDWIVGSADGWSVAVAHFFGSGIGGGGPVPPVRVRFSGGPVRRIPYLIPIGFDASGRLIGTRDGGIVAYDPARGRFVDLHLGPDGGIVTPRGRWIVAQPERIPRTHGRTVVRAIRVADGSRHAWRLPRAQWQVSPELSTDRYVVIWDVDDRGRLGIIDLSEGWLGFLRFRARPGLDAAVTDIATRCGTPQRMVAC